MWNPYLGIHMLSFARFVFTAALLVWSVSSGQADGGPKDLWSLYLREHSASLCGRGLSEEEETELDEAQHIARLRASLSLAEAAHLYRRSREAAHSARGALCSSGEELPRDLHDLGTQDGASRLVEQPRAITVFSLARMVLAAIAGLAFGREAAPGRDRRRARRHEA